MRCCRFIFFFPRFLHSQSREDAEILFSSTCANDFVFYSDCFLILYTLKVFFPPKYVTLFKTLSRTRVANVWEGCATVQPVRLPLNVAMKGNEQGGKCRTPREWWEKKGKQLPS